MKKSNKHSHIDHSITFAVILFVIILFSAIQIAAQEKEKPNQESSASIMLPDAPQTAGDVIEFKNESGNPIITITDEGSNKGSITLPLMLTVPSSTVNKLYNEHGKLKFNGFPVGGSINALVDAAIIGSSIFLGSFAGYSGEFGFIANLGIGSYSLFSLTNGNENIAIGESALYSTLGNSNLAIGNRVGFNLGNGSNNIFIGNRAGYIGESTSGNIFLGHEAGYNETSNDKLYIENSNSSSPLIWGDFANDDVKINGDFQVTDYVGIGTPTGYLEAKLMVLGDEGVLFQGTHGNGTAKDLGGGTRFHFYPKKSAIRSGYVSGTQWDDANIGTFSSAFGNTTTASADASFASGAYTNASGNSSTAMGYSTTTIGNRSMSIGSETIARTFASFVVGRFNAGTGSATSWVATDPLFEIGIGASSGSPENAMTVLKNGNVGIGEDNPGFKLHVNGTAGKPGGGSWSVASDIRLKKDIEEFSDGLDVISKIHTVSFNYNGKAGYPTDKRYIGVIAQEMNKIAPYMISETKADDGESYLQFDPSAMDFIAANAIKELNQKNIEQEIKIKELENRLNKLESLINWKKFADVSSK